MTEARGPAASPVDNDAAMRQLAIDMFDLGQQIMRMKPAPRVSDSTRGMPVVMRALLQSKDPLSPGELSRICGVSDARIANTLRVLEQRGYVERRTSQADRRRVEVMATEKGIETVSRRFEEGLACASSFLAELGEDDARDFVRILGRIRDVMVARRKEGREFSPPEL